MATEPVTAIDLHACGEPGRVIVAGVPPVPGASMYEKMCWLRDHGDDLRLRMLREPRGYPAANCNLIQPSAVAGADAGFIIMEQTEYAPMSGSNTICVATALVESGLVPRPEGSSMLRLETPAGVIEVEVEVVRGKVTRVTFQNVPAFAVHVGVPLDVPHLGKVTVDIAWGGMFYVLAEAAALGLELIPEKAAELARAGRMILAACQERYPVVHPENPGLTGPTIAELYGPPVKPGSHGRNAVIVATGTLDWDKPATWTGALDRSPCGTGTCARMAVLSARGELALGEDYVHEGILGTTFTGRLRRPTKVGPYAAAVPSLSGRAWVTGRAQYELDPTDPFPTGYTLGDIWPA